MRHLVKGRRLNRTPSHLLALKRNLVCELFARERITTTVAKAKELRPFAEKLITLARRGAAELEAAGNKNDAEARPHRLAALHVRRQLIQALGGKRIVVNRVKRGDEWETISINVVEKLMSDIGPRFSARPGGYTRVIKRAQRRLGDGGVTAHIEMLAANEPIRRKKKTSAAPAPSPAPAPSAT